MISRRGTLLGAGLGTLGLTSKGQTMHPNTHLRATVQAPGNSGDPFTVLVDGGDSTITVVGAPGYAPVAGDRVVVSRLGGQVIMVGRIGGTHIITAGLFRTDGPSNPRIEISNSTDPNFDQGGLIAFYVVGGSWTPGSLSAEWIAGPPNVGTLSLVGPMGPGGVTTPGLALSYITGGTGSIASLDAKTVNLGASATLVHVLNACTIDGGLTLHGGGTVTGAVSSNSAITTTGQITGDTVVVTTPPTTASAANVRFGGSNSLQLVTSLTAHKVDPQPYDLPAASRVLKVKPMTFYDRGEVESNDGSTEGLRRIHGVMAEQVEQVAPEFAEYDEHGELAGVDYRALSIALLAVVTDQEKRITALERTQHGNGKW